MSNAKLKEQIEAAKIALVHSAEVDSYVDTPPKSVPMQPSLTIDPNPQVDSAGEVPNSSADAGKLIIGQDMVAQSDFKKLETRLQGLEEQIKNQQRDLHTLLQKLRGITTRSQAVTEPKKSNSTKKWLLGAALCAISFGAAYHWLGADTITSTIYQATGLIVALIDTLAGKI